MDKPLEGPNPGLLFAYSKVAKQENFSPDEFQKWYEEIHIPDALKVPGVEKAYRWENLDATAEWQFLATYPLKDLGCLGSQEMRDVPLEHETLPGSHKIFDLAQFEIRAYKYVQLYEREKTLESQPDFVIAVALTPADDEDFNNWYLQELLKEFEQIKAWRKTERFDLQVANRYKGPAEKCSPSTPQFLAMHFFDGEVLPEREILKVAKSMWSERILSNLKDQRIDIFKRKSSFKKEV